MDENKLPSDASGWDGVEAKKQKISMGSAIRR
jgi:hypothetical protein